jgi:hypothetical protein
MSDAAVQRSTVRTERAQERAAKEEGRAAKESAPGLTKRFENKLVALLELGMVALLIKFFHKPLEHAALKIAEDVYELGKLIADGFKDVEASVKGTIVAAEQTIRKDLRLRYFEDPILSHKLGPNLYSALILGGDSTKKLADVPEEDRWDLTIQRPDGAYPSRVPDLFVAGTGRGAIRLRGKIAHGVSLQIKALTHWFVGNSARLQTIGDFPLSPTGV